METGTTSNAQSSSKNAMSIYKDVNQSIGRFLQIGLDAFNWLFKAHYKFPKGSTGRHASKSKKGRSLF